MRRHPHPDPCNGIIIIIYFFLERGGEAQQGGNKPPATLKRACDSHSNGTSCEGAAIKCARLVSIRVTRGGGVGGGGGVCSPPAYAVHGGLRDDLLLNAQLDAQPLALRQLRVLQLLGVVLDVACAQRRWQQLNRRWLECRGRQRRGPLCPCCAMTGRWLRG